MRRLCFFYGNSWTLDWAAIGPPPYLPVNQVLELAFILWLLTQRESCVSCARSWIELGVNLMVDAAKTVITGVSVNRVRRWQIDQKWTKWRKKQAKIRLNRVKTRSSLVFRSVAINYPNSAHWQQNLQTSQRQLLLTCWLSMNSCH